MPRMDATRMIEWLKAHPEVTSLRAAVCDLNGALRGKRLPTSRAGSALRGGTRMPLSVTGVDIWGEDIVGGKLVFETGDADGICEWTGRGPLPIGWTAQPTALIPLWLARDDGSAFPGDPRRALAAVVDRYAALGLTPVTATELEFYLVDPSGERPAAPISPTSGKLLDSDSVLALRELDHFERFLDDVYAACEAQGVPADSAIAENGPGQFEINLMHAADPLRVGDDAVLFKEIVRGIARRHGLAATFMSKPYGDRAGSGLHVHFSLVDRDGANVFDDGSARGSDTMRHAVGGLLAALPESTLLFAPHMNSFRRLRPGNHAPSAVAWGYENRTAAIRIPGGDPAARRIEHRVAGADANPYLVLAGILGAALAGIERRLIPADPIAGDAYAQRLPSIPPDWASAVDAFEQGPMIPEMLSPTLQRMLVDCKRQEMEVFARRVTDFEYHTYLETV
jgi:glutamine synthetase